MESPQWTRHRKLDQSTANIRPDLGKPENQIAESYLEGDEILHPQTKSQNPNDVGVPREDLHPLRTPPPDPNADTNQERVAAVRDFIFMIAHINEAEYGDWQRRAAIYWGYLADALAGVDSKDVQKTLGEMIRIIDFNPDFRILETGRKVIEHARHISELLGAPLPLAEIPQQLSGQTSEAPVPNYSLRMKNTVKPDVAPVTGGPNGQGFLGKG